MCDIESCGPTKAAPPTPVSRAERRAFLRGLGTLPLAAVLADPRLAWAAASRLQAVEVGGTRAYLAAPARTPAASVLLIHEWWGLNDQIKAVAAEFAAAGYLALAVDLYEGKVATSRVDARQYMGQVDPAKARGTLAAWVQWLRAHEASNRKVGTVGWCFGGGWSLNASLVAPVDATVIYYGNVKKSSAELAPLAGPVLGHFATRDGWINRDMVGGFEAAMTQAGKSDLSVHWYEADHAFANPTSARYDEADAQLSWTRTLAFFGQHLKT